MVFPFETKQSDETQNEEINIAYVNVFDLYLNNNQTAFIRATTPVGREQTSRKNDRQIYSKNKAYKYTR